MICYLYPDPTFLFFAPDLPALLYYSHIPSAIIALLIGFFVYLNQRDRLPNKLLLVIATSFSAWVTLSLLVWAGNDGALFTFIWPFYSILTAFMAVFSVYFTYAFVYKEDVSIRLKFVFLLLLLPVLLLAHTNVSISGFNLAWCDAFQYEGQMFKYYTYFLGFLAMAWIFGVVIANYRKVESEFRKQIVLMGIGIEFFLFSFMTTTFVVTELTALGIFEDSRLEFYGLFGMTFFMAMIGFLIVRFKAFNVGMLAARALVIALLILVGSQFTYSNSTSTTIILTTVTFVLTLAVGIVLVRNVKREVEQRQEIEQLATRLAAANKKLKQLDKLKSEFVSIASHQLRSPLTSIRGYASMLIEGSFGKIPQSAVEPLTRIETSAKNMALSVEDYLNVSRIESGNMKYELSDFNLKEEAEKIADDIRPQAMKKGLLLTFKSDLDSKGVVHADIGKTVQILHNLINNAMKYTPKGSITVFAHDDVKKKQVYVEIIDTGIGVAPDQLEHLFAKFERAKGANSVNTSGTGLGLFVAQKMAQEMGGDVTAHSEGEGKGSHFILTLPLTM